jgi:hypothetical protein
MNWMFSSKALGTLVVALATLAVPVEKKPGPLPVEVAQKKDHEHDPKPPAPTPLPTPPPEPAPKPPKPPDVDSDPDLRPLARAVITTRDGEEVPKVWPAGVPMELSAMRSVAGDLPQSMRWDIFPEWVDKYSYRGVKNRTVSIATGTKPKTIKVTLYVAKDDAFDMASVTVSIRLDPLEPGNDDRPRPGPKPPEPVPPEPTPPPSLSTVGKQVYDLALKHIPDIGARKDKVIGLAVSHESIASDVSQAVAGVPAYAALKQPQAIIDATVKSNQAVVGSDRPAYVPFFEALNIQVLKPLVKTTLSTAGGHIEVWKDIGAGLRASVP